MKAVTRRSIIESMVIDMNEAHVRTLDQVRQVLAGTQAMQFQAAADDAGRYAWIESVLRRFEYRRLGRADRGPVLAYLQRLSGYSRAQITRLVSRWSAGKPLVKNYGAPRQPFTRLYTPADVALLADVDCAMGTLSGPATACVLRRQRDVFGDERFCLGIRKIFDTLLRFEMKLHPKAFIVRADKTEGMAAKAVHMPICGRNATVAHHHGDLMQRFGQERPKVPVVLGRTHVGARITLYGMVEVRELQRVAQKEDRRIVAHQVPVALFGIKLHGKTANVAFGVRRSTLARHRGKPHKHLSFLAYLRKHCRLGVGRNILRDGKRAKSARPLGVHTALRDHFPVKVGQFFQKPDILQQHRAARTCSDDIIIIDDRRAGAGG